MIHCANLWWILDPRVLFPCWNATNNFERRSLVMEVGAMPDAVFGGL
ncbi:hypothetical protein RchiOBHm_Chr1g0354231 [Rosa chinensis]|uniref:Uncharacterized protein n=1 Tax=Rosa chinensis TaxID=74649 RepID=A0A2P6SH33_ROSCH|nr:hypothetical protein RchiOBHm_Chr1g0354231 [Rosa chinensis]